MCIIFKKVLVCIGLILSICGLYFLLKTVIAELDRWPDYNLSDFITLTACSFLYGMSNIFLTVAWQSLLSYLGINISFVIALGHYGVFQAVKYVPGNVAHFLGRQALGASQGWSGWVIAKSSILEICLLGLVGASYGALLIPMYFLQVNMNNAIIIWFLFLILIELAAWAWIGLHVMMAICLYFLFLGISGFIFMAILNSVHGESVNAFYNNASLVIGAYVVAWLIGLIIPGAPAGIGIREIALLFLLEGFVSELALTLATIMSRLTCVIGDLLFFGFSIVLGQNKSRGTPLHLS